MYIEEHALTTNIDLTSFNSPNVVNNIWLDGDVSWYDIDIIERTVGLVSNPFYSFLKTII